METPLCTAVFWRGGEKIELNGLEPNAVQRLSVTGERKVNLSFLRDYPCLLYTSPEVAEDMVEFQVKALVDEMERIRECVQQVKADA